MKFKTYTVVSPETKKTLVQYLNKVVGKIKIRKAIRNVNELGYVKFISD